MSIQVQTMEHNAQELKTEISIAESALSTIRLKSRKHNLQKTDQKDLVSAKRT